MKNIAEGKPPKIKKNPFVEDREDFDFDQEFDSIVDQIATLASSNEGGVELLAKFEWKGLIALHLKQISLNPKAKTMHKGTFIINLKAKETYLNAFLELVQLDKLVKEKW